MKLFSKLYLGLTLALSLISNITSLAEAEERKQALSKSEMLLQRLAQYRDHYERDASRMTLIEAMRMGLEQNPSLAISYAQIQQSEWQAIGIQREWYPSILAESDSPGIAGYSVDRYTNKSKDNTDVIDRSNTTTGRALTSPRIELQWTFFDPTRTPRLRSELASLRSEELLFDIGARDLVLQIQQSYYTLQKYAALESDYRQLYEIAQQVTAFAKRYKQLVVSQSSDISQLKSFEYALLTERINTHERVLASAAQLAQNLSLQPGKIAMPADPLELNGSWNISLQSTIDQALTLREEIKQSLANSESFFWDSKASANITLPSLFINTRAELLNGQFSSNDRSQNPTVTSTGRERDLYTDVGLYFNWLLFDGGTNLAEANAFRMKSKQAEKQAELDRLTVTSQVQTSHASYISSMIVVDSASDEVRLALRALEEARHDFASGRTNATTLVQTLDAVRKAKENYRTAVTKHNIAVAELYRYSSSWPDTALSILQKRVQQLRRK
jgi:outer membrane protein TolC